MRFVTFESDLSIDTIMCRAEHYLEFKNNHPLSLFSHFNSPRVGLHIYKHKNGFSGYYENGNITRRGLETAKVWFRIWIKDLGDKVRIRVFSYYAPIFTSMLAGIMAYTLAAKELVGFIFVTLGFVLTSFAFLKDENAMFAGLEKLFE